MNKFKIILLYTLVASVWLLNSCLSTDRAQGGSGTEIVGETRYPEDTAQSKMRINHNRMRGIPAVDIPIFVLPVDYEIPEDSVEIPVVPDVWSDKNGSFGIKNVPLGSYNVYAKDSKGNSSIKQINVTEENRRYFVDTLYLVKTGTLKLTINWPVEAPAQWYVGIRGTDIVFDGKSKVSTVYLAGIPEKEDFEVYFRITEPFSSGFNFKIPKIDAGESIEKTIDILDYINLF